MGLTACTTLPPPSPPPETNRPSDEIEGQGAFTSFELHGRIALRQGLVRDTLVLDWLHTDHENRMRFSSPVGTVLGEVLEGPEGARLQWVNQAPRSAARADLLLKDSIGWTVPLDELAQWVQGAIPKDTEVVLTGEGAQRRMQFSVANWQADLAQWRLVGGDWYPGRVTLKGESQELKLVIDRWSLTRHD